MYIENIITLLKRNWIKFLLSFFMAILLFYPVGYFVLENNEAALEIPQITKEGKGVGVYVINLDKSKERYEYIKNSVNKLNFKLEKIQAIDGSIISDDEINQKVDLNSYKLFLGHLPKRGMIGCCLSHIKTWQKFLNSDAKYAVIFEDDVEFDPIKLKSTIDELIEVDNLWDVVSFEISHNGFPLVVKKLPNGQDLALYLTEITHAGGYIINKTAAKKLLEKALPLKMPIDHYFTRSWEFDLKFLGIENPRLVRQNFGSSDIAKTKNISQEKLSIRENIQKSIFKIQSYIARVIYNLKLYYQLKI